MNQKRERLGKVFVTVFLLMSICMAAVTGAWAAEETAPVFQMTYLVDGEVFEEQEYAAGETITPPQAPEKANFLFIEWKELPKTMPNENGTVSAVYGFDGMLAREFDQVYECELKVSEDLAVTMYLRMNQEGNFVFSRSTDFSSTEKGAGKIYRKSEPFEIADGEYAVDISWSPMAEMITPILSVDSQNQTFSLYGKETPSESKGSGTIAYGDGYYTLNFTDGTVTSFTYEEGVITFTSKLWYGTASFERRDEEENFVSYQAVKEVSDPTDTAAETGKQEAENGEEYSEKNIPVIAPGEYCLVYYVVNQENVAVGDYISAFEVTDKGSILFTSPFWFGATTPQYLAEDGTVTYPEFVRSEKAIEKEIDAAAILSKEEKTEAEKTEKEEADEKDSTGFQTGTYGGTYTTTAMGSSLTYSCTITFRKDGTYTYTVKFRMMGQTYTENENGTYKVQGNALTLTSSDGTVMNGSVSGNQISITRKASSFAFSTASITFTYGYTPGITSSDASVGDKENPKESEKETEKETNQGQETEDYQKPTTGEGGIAGGTYQVDISWSMMAGMFSPVLKIDADRMTFMIYNASAPEVSKGSGTISYKDGIYTLHFEDGNKTTFTYKEKVITFTSPLYFGKASFNSAGEDGVFVPYTASLKQGQSSDSSKETEQETETEQSTEQETETEQSTEQETETETEQSTEQESETEPDIVPAVKPGVYCAKQETSAMGQTITYRYTLELKENGNYTHTLNYTVMGSEQTEQESGTYQAENGILTLTDSSDKNLSGTVNADGTLSITRYASSMAETMGKPMVTIVYAPGTPEEDKKEEETENKKPVFQTGTYSGTYQLSAMGSSVTYSYTLNFKTDNTYLYTVQFVMGGTKFTQTETGSYTVSEESFQLTSAGSEVKDEAGNAMAIGQKTGTMTGSVNAAGQAITLKRYVSNYASKEAELSLSYGTSAARAVSVQETAVREKAAAEEKETEMETELAAGSSDETVKEEVLENETAGAEGIAETEMETSVEEGESERTERSDGTEENGNTETPGETETGETTETSEKNEESERTERSDGTQGSETTETSGRTEMGETTEGSDEKETHTEKSDGEKKREENKPAADEKRSAETRENSGSRQAETELG